MTHSYSPFQIETHATSYNHNSAVFHKSYLLVFAFCGWLDLDIGVTSLGKLRL